MNSRRKFLQGGLLTSVAALTPIAGSEAKPSPTVSSPGKPASGQITILQTTDVHCQLHAHDELFWEKDELVFRKAGGYAHMATALDRMKQSNPENTITLDTGDMFQGSMLSVKTTGQAFVPLLNAMNYDLYLPGNWEVVYY